MVGIDPYTNAISDLYQDNFKEGIFTGKGIYDLKTYSKVLKDVIPENVVIRNQMNTNSCWAFATLAPGSCTLIIIIPSSGA